MIFIICAILIWRHHIQWIHPDPTLHRLKMQVTACAVASIAHIPNNLPCRYRLTCGDGSLHHMGIACGQAHAVIQQNLIAVAVVPAADQHRTAVGGEDRRTLRCGNIRAAMPGIAEGVHFPEVAGYISVPMQRPLQGAAADHVADTAAQCQQIRAQFVRQQLVKNVALVLREIVFFSQLG